MTNSYSIYYYHFRLRTHKYNHNIVHFPRSYFRPENNIFRFLLVRGSDNISFFFAYIF